jgi:hypothetical protein
MDPLFLATYDNDLILLEFSPTLHARLARENLGAGGRPDIDFVFQAVIALNRAALFRPGRGDEDAAVLEVTANRLTGEDLARWGYTPQEFRELIDLLRAHLQAVSPDRENRVDWIANAYRNEYERLRAAQSALKASRSPPATAAPETRSWQIYLASVESWMAWIGSMGGGIAVLYGGWRWTRRRRRKKA